jgi:hypothetical protein
MSIPFGNKRKAQLVQGVAHDAAVEAGFPWEMKRLMRAALQGGQTTGSARGISDHVRAEAARIRAQLTSGELPEPSNEQIREALMTFTTDEWRALIREFDRRDVDILRDYLDANKEPLMRWLGRGKFNVIFAERMTRHFLLFFRQPIRETTTSDAMWAAYYYNEARCQNRACEPLPSIKRSGAETGGPNNIAEILSVRGGNPSPYKVRMMLRRMEQTPFEAFDGEPAEYFFWATDLKAYEHHLRLKKTAQRPSRDPDPFFITTN